MSTPEVLSENGKITLRGEAESPAQRDLTGEYAKGVDGVKALIMRLKWCRP
jgi:osmotically-inducible protein OsmY